MADKQPTSDAFTLRGTVETNLTVPTLDQDDDLNPIDAETSNPIKVVRWAGGMRVLMGEKPGEFDPDAPNLLIERHKNGNWFICVHVDDGDEIALIRFSPGKRTVVENVRGEIVIQDVDGGGRYHRAGWQAAVVAVVEPETCDLCGEALEAGNGDNWDGLCPGCADAVSERMDGHGSRPQTMGRDQAIEALRLERATG